MARNTEHGPARPESAAAAAEEQPAAEARAAPAEDGEGSGEPRGPQGEGEREAESETEGVGVGAVGESCVEEIEEYGRCLLCASLTPPLPLLGARKYIYFRRNDVNVPGNQPTNRPMDRALDLRDTVFGN